MSIVRSPLVWVFSNWGLCSLSSARISVLGWRLSASLLARCPVCSVLLGLLSIGELLCWGLRSQSLVIFCPSCQALWKPPRLMWVSSGILSFLEFCLGFRFLELRQVSICGLQALREAPWGYPNCGTLFRDTHLGSRYDEASAPRARLLFKSLFSKWLGSLWISLAIMSVVKPPFFLRVTFIEASTL